MEVIERNGQCVSLDVEDGGPANDRLMNVIWGGGGEKYRRVRAEILAIDSSWLQNEPESCKSNHSAVTRRFIQVAGGSLLNRKMERSTG